MFHQFIFRIIIKKVKIEKNIPSRGSRAAEPSSARAAVGCSPEIPHRTAAPPASLSLSLSVVLPRREAAARS
jgi:hypothetical protein